MNDDITLAVLEEQVKNVGKEVVDLKKSLENQRVRDSEIDFSSIQRLTKLEESMCHLHKISYFLITTTLGQILALIYQFIGE